MFYAGVIICRHAGATAKVLFLLYLCRAGNSPRGMQTKFVARQQGEGVKII